MFFIKKLLLGLTAVVLIFAGGSGTQSSNLLMQGGGFVGMIVGFVVLYLFTKIVWRAMGCLPSLLIICAVVGFILYAIGAFNGGVEKVIPNIKTFLGADHKASISLSENDAHATEMPVTEPSSDYGSSAPVLGENFSDEPLAAADEEVPEINNLPQPEVPATVKKQPAQMPARPSGEEGGLSKLVSSLMGKDSSSPTPPARFNPNDYPAVRGTVQIINGDTLAMRGRYLKIYGIDAPESNQTCADSKGRSYFCGKEAARWLKSWISSYEIECHILQQDSRGNMVGTCSLGQYDIGAALVNAGWAVADTKVTGIYLPYEQQAQQKGSGLWQGQFYKPWDWREIQSKKPKIKIIKPKGAKRNLLDF